MLPDEVYERIARCREAVEKYGAAMGFHGHNNLSLGVANTLEAIRGGATYIDTCIKGFGAGAGNCAIEPLVAILEKMGYNTGIDLYKAMDFGDKYLQPLMPRTMHLESDHIMLGYAGVFSSFVLFARRAAERYGVDARDVIREVGRRGATEGQEDLCIEAAYMLSHAKNE
jgi:4-hydroxy-2-oxovalerate aldolase